MTLTERLLPTSGLVCVSVQSHKTLQNNFYDTPAIAETVAMGLVDKGRTVYIAQATYNTKRRLQSKVSFVKNFFLDIDCGPEKPFATQADGVDALKHFCAEVELPLPVIVNSGNGLYAHWIFKEAVTAAQWKAGADTLKELTKLCSFRVDQARTADSASVLRPVGSLHRKDPENLKRVVIHSDAPDFSFAELVAIMDKAVHKHGGMKNSALAPPKPASDLNAAFYMEYEPVADAEKIATNCNQMGMIKKSLGNVEEPLWYASVQLLRHCVRGIDYAHEWSCGHPDYSEEATDTKLYQLEKNNIGPTTCQRFGELNATGCIGCKHKSTKMKSPITLGTIVPEALKEEEEEVSPPANYTRTAQGVFFAPEGGESLRVYDHDLRPTACIRDMNAKCEMVVVNHRMAHTDKDSEFLMRTSTVLDPRALFALLADEHVLVVGTESKKHMSAYMEGFIKKIQNSKPISKAYSQMGWFDEDDGTLGFTLGDTVYHKNQPPVKVKLTANADITSHIKAVGSKSAWVASTRVFNDPTTHAHAFGFLAGAFGAPLMKFTGFPGALVAMVGRSGTGKTLMESLAQSVYGNPERLMMLKDDTKNALIGRLGVYGSLPLTIDEVTNMHPLELSELVYRVTQGRDKVRLNRSAVERSVSNTWNTIAVVSSNHSIVEKLATFKGDASAEINRVFEFVVPESKSFNREDATDLYRTLMTNYGNIGPEYVKHLVDNQEYHHEQIRILTDKIAEKANVQGDERYWVALSAVTLYGGSVAKQQGFIDFDLKGIAEWVINQIKEGQEVKKESIVDPVGLFGQFLAKYSSNMLGVTRVERDGRTFYDAAIEPRGELVWRKELWSSRVFVSRGVLKRFCADTNSGFRDMRDGLALSGILIDSNVRKNLGAFTSFNTTKQPCWEIDMLAEGLEGVIPKSIGGVNGSLSGL